MAEETKDECDIEIVNNLLDKTILRQLHLMEEKMICELNIEVSINNGSIHLAKSRYIMGHSSVSGSRLPMENSAEFSASTVCKAVDEDSFTQFKVCENDADNTVNPLHWFGVLVPQNLHKAKSIFQNTINYAVECANIQLQIVENMKNLDYLYRYKKMVNK